MTKKRKKQGRPEKIAAQPKPETKKLNLRPAAIAISAVLILAVSLFAIRYFVTHRSVAFGSCKDCNVLFITMDTTRADHLPAYGYTAIKTPNLDALASGSYVFEDAISQVPLTLPSHTTMMTGRLPIAHGVRDNAGFFLDQKETTIAEILKGAGYSTSAFVSAFVLDSRWQLNQGFDLYYDNFNIGQFQDLNPGDVQRRGDDTEIEAEKWLEEHYKDKFFSWVHFYDPHEPYDPPEPFRSEYPDSPYDGEIAFTDQVIGKLLNKVEQLGITGKTIIVLTGDHGESLGQHKEATHAMFVYDATQHVPLMIRVPSTRGGRLAGVVRHIDLAPTLLELLGIKPIPEMQGASLISTINGKDKTERLAYSESVYAEVHYGWSPLRSIASDQYKYIDAPRPELYDRKADPGETNNIIGDKATIAKVLKSDLDEMISKLGSKTLAGPIKPDAETEEVLRSLGYLSGNAKSTPESRKIDPKDKIHLAQGIHSAMDAVEKKNYQLGLDRILPVLQEDPDMVDAHFCAGVCYIGLEKYDKGIDEMLKTLSYRPDHTMALYNIGYTYELENDLPKARDWYLKVLKYEPKHLFASIKLAHIYRQLNDPQESRKYFLVAVQSYEKALSATKGEKSKSALYSTLGEIYFGAGEIEKAEENLKAAVQLTPDQDSLNYNLAEIYEAKGDYNSAVRAYRREIEVSPKNYKALNNLGIIYKDSNHLDEAAACFQKVIELLPEDPHGYVLLVSTYKKMGKEQEADQVIREARQRNVELK